MNQVLGLTDDATQNISLTLTDGSILTFTLTFVDQQLGWFINNLVYGNFQLDGFRLFNAPNIFFQYMNQIPWGLMCQTTGDREPNNIEDLLSGATDLYILTQAECQQYLSQLNGEQ